MLRISRRFVKFVSNVLCSLNMDELNMFNFLENELHIVRTIGPSLETLESACQKKCYKFRTLLMRNIKLKKNTLNAITNVIHYESQVMGFASSCIKFMSFFYVE